jgi:hypothetical protein
MRWLSRDTYVKAPSESDRRRFPLARWCCRSPVKGVVGALLTSLAVLGLGGCSGSDGGSGDRVAQPSAESQFCSFMFSVRGSPASSLSATSGTGDNFNDAGLRAAAERFVTALGSNNSEAVANAASEVETACKRLGDWHSSADAQ